MKAMNVRLPDELHEELRQAAFGHRTSMNDLIIDGVRMRLNTLAKEALMTTIYLYEDNGGGLHIQKDNGPIWELGVCGAIYGPDAGTFEADAKAWLDGSWEPNEGDGQHTYGDTEPAEGNELIATCKDGTVYVTRDGSGPVAGFSGRAYLGVNE